jgi:hypothetical protein
MLSRFATAERAGVSVLATSQNIECEVVEVVPRDDQPLLIGETRADACSDSGPLSNGVVYSFPSIDRPL